MGQKFAAFDPVFKIAFYDSVDSPVPPGVDTIAITEEQWQECLANPGYTVQNGELIAPTQPTASQQLAEEQTSLCVQIDSTADAVYVAIGGPSPGRLAEYQQAEADALAYKAAGYTGTVPATVACWVTASGMTAQAAADNIIATATAWIACLQTIRAARLLGKKAVTSAASIADAQAAADSAIADIKAVQAQA